MLVRPVFKKEQEPTFTGCLESHEEPYKKIKQQLEARLTDIKAYIDSNIKTLRKDIQSCNIGNTEPVADRNLTFDMNPSSEVNGQMISDTITNSGPTATREALHIESNQDYIKPQVNTNEVHLHSYREMSDNLRVIGNEYFNKTGGHLCITYKAR